MDPDDDLALLTRRPEVYVAGATRQSSSASDPLGVLLHAISFTLASVV